MIIVWINKRNWKTPGPIVNMSVRNAASFAGLGYETHLCVGAGADSDTAGDIRDFYGLGSLPALRIHRVSRMQKRGNNYSLSVFRYAWRLIRTLRHQDHVAVFTRESGFLPFLAWLRTHPRVSGYYELHDLYADLSWCPRKRTGFYREWFYEHLFLPRIDGVVCITRSQQELYRKIFPSLPSVAFPLGTTPVSALPQPEERRKRRTLMYVGHMHADKGIDFLLKAAAILARQNIQTVFLGGKPEKIPHFQKKAAEIGAGDAATFISFQPPEQMHRALDETASIGIVMLKDTFYNRYLTCPVKALDYLSHGIPAIGSDLPSVREVLDDSGTYVKADDLNGFAGSVLSLLDDADRYARKSEQALQRANEISWEKRARILVAFAEEQKITAGGTRHPKRRFSLMGK